MKRILLTLLVVVFALGLFAAAGFTGYRFGYAQGVQATANGEVLRPQMGPFNDIRPNRMPMHDFGFERGFQREFRRGDFPMMERGFFSPWTFLWRIALLGLIAWFVYWLFTRSGWQLTRTTQTPVTQPTPTKTETKEPDQGA